MKRFLIPVAEENRKHTACGVIFLLVISAVSLILAPLLMPESYSQISHTTSESAAQGVKGAWLARLGFLTFGIAVLWLSISFNTAWAGGAVFFHAGFGILMIATAAFSIRSWIPDAPYDGFEDFLHSLTASSMGFFFNFGVLVRLLQRRMNNTKGAVFDLITILTTTIISILMMNLPEMDGLLQRLMFLTAYIWYGKETAGNFTESVKPGSLK